MPYLNRALQSGDNVYVKGSNPHREIIAGCAKLLLFTVGDENARMLIWAHVADHKGLAHSALKMINPINVMPVLTFKIPSDAGGEGG